MNSMFGIEFAVNEFSAFKAKAFETGQRRLFARL